MKNKTKNYDFTNGPTNSLSVIRPEFINKEKVKIVNKSKFTNKPIERK